MLTSLNLRFDPVSASQPHVSRIAAAPVGCCRRLLRVNRRRSGAVVCSSRDDDSPEGEKPSDTTSQVPDILPVAGSGVDWREFRAQLVASASRQEQGEDAGAATANPRTGLGDGVWAHPIPRPEKGCLLIAHPLMFQDSQVYFRQAVILLFEHGDYGSAGIILNRRTTRRIGELQRAELLGQEFADDILHLGGDVGENWLTVLHPHGDVRQVIEVINGVFMGSPEGVLEAVRSNQHPLPISGRGVVLASSNETGDEFWHKGIAEALSRQPGREDVTNDITLFAGALSRQHGREDVTNDITLFAIWGQHMPFPPSTATRFFSKYEFTAKYLLCCSDPEPLPMATLLEHADEDCRARWESLSLGYTETMGLPALRAEIATMYSPAKGIESIVLAPEEGIFLAMLALLSPSDHVVCTSPGYQSLSQVALSVGCEVSPWNVSASAEGEFSFDVEQLKQLLRPTTRCVIVNFPHNPTGALPSAAEWGEILQICAKAGVWLFSDEMYRETEEDPLLRLRPACDEYERAITLSGLSKAYGLPGLRLGWLASQDKGILQRIAELKDYTTICSAAPVEVLGLIALRNRDLFLGRVRSIISENKVLLDEFFKARTDIFQWAPPKAGTIAFPSLLAAEPIEEFCQRCVEDVGVLLLPATVYSHADSIEQRRFRLGIGRKNMQLGLQTLSDYLLEKPPR